MKRQVHPTPAEQGLDSCSVCRLVSSPEERSDISRCPRCNAKLQQRKPHSIEQCWALTIAAYLLYIPANLMTMMETGSLLGYRKDTIMSGIIYLWQTDFQGIAAIVFIASILVPLFKLLALTLLLISVQRKSTWWPMQRMRLYRMVEQVGRWSMLDIYVVTFLSAVVQISTLATVRAGGGAVAFGAVVVLTMFAATRFDPRLIWDPLRKESLQ